MTDLFFNPNYAKVYRHIDGQEETFKLSCPYGNIINTYIKREVPWKLDGDIYYDIVTPYGYGGPLASDITDINKLMEAYKKTFTSYCHEKHIICEFIRFHLFDNVDIREHYYGITTKQLDDIVVDTTEDYDTQTWMKFQHKVRKNVKKAIKSGLQIIIENNLTHISDFLDVYNKTMDRNNAKDYYYFKIDYFENIAKYLPENYVFFHVLKDGKVISTELVLYADKYAYSFLGGTLADYYEFRPNDFLKNEIIKWCHQKQIQKFVLGGGYCKDDGIYRYKKGFTQSPDVPFYTGCNIFDQKKYDEFVALRALQDAEFNPNSNYFPLYRA